MNRPQPHIAFLIPTLERNGGAEQQVIDLAQGLAARGRRVSLLALSGEAGESVTALRQHGVEFVSLGMRKGLADPRGWLRLNRWIRARGPQILHAHLPHAAWMARWSRLLAPVPVVVDTIHTAGIGTTGRKLGYRASEWLTDATTAVSSGAAGAWNAAGILSAKFLSRGKLAIVPNGIDTGRWKPDAGTRERIRTELGLTGEFLWLAAGRLEPVKNFSALLHLMPLLPSNARLVIAGTGSLGNALWQEAESLGLAGRVRFLGHEPNLTRWMQAADGFVLSSHWEGLPLTLLEAGACGLPCVSTAVAGAVEIIDDGCTGFLVPVQDTTALGDAMLSMMKKNREQRAQMGVLARQRIAERYSLPSVLDQWEAYYAALLARARRPRRIGFTTGLSAPATASAPAAADAASGPHTHAAFAAIRTERAETQ